MMNYVIKAGGSGNIIEESNKADDLPEWLNYRRVKINSKYFEKVCLSLVEFTKKNNKIFYINGGVGAYLFLDFGRSLGLDDRILDQTGCDIINNTSRLLLEKTRSLDGNVCPFLVDVQDIKTSIINKFDIFFIKANPMCKSSDALAAKVATNLEKANLIYFKYGIPTYYVGFEKPVDILEFKIVDLIERAKNKIEKPGDNFILDKEALKLIYTYKIDTTLINSDDISKYINDESDKTIRKTKIV
ncbi:hypothetical protein [Sutcliffiella horikoshii]|uniref:hypothetical protein n=1 Tax=Sutcliffiella horikoshii TaxID=79883 RepID=UPI00384D732C